MTANTHAAPKRRRIRHRRCKYCSALGTWTAPISSRGMCPPCGARRLREACEQMHSREGEHWQMWLAGMVRMLGEATGGRVLLSLPTQTVESPGHADVDRRNMA